MGEAGFNNLPKRVGFCCAMQTMILGIGIHISISMYGGVEVVNYQNTSTVTDVIENWTRIPFTEVRVTEDKCMDDEYRMFYRIWYGTKSGCLVNKIVAYDKDSKQTILTDSDNNEYLTEQFLMTDAAYDEYIREKYCYCQSSSQYVKNDCSWVPACFARKALREPCIPIPKQDYIVQD